MKKKKEKPDEQQDVRSWSPKEKKWTKKVEGKGERELERFHKDKAETERTGQCVRHPERNLIGKRGGKEGKEREGWERWRKRE